MDPQFRWREAIEKGRNREITVSGSAEEMSLGWAFPKSNPLDETSPNLWRGAVIKATVSRVAGHGISQHPTKATVMCRHCR